MANDFFMLSLLHVYYQYTHYDLFNGNLGKKLPNICSTVVIGNTYL